MILLFKINNLKIINKYLMMMLIKNKKYKNKFNIFVMILIEIFLKKNMKIL